MMPVGVVETAPGVRHDADVKSAVKYGGLLLQLGALLLIVWRFRIENDAFLHLAALTFAGFAIHYFLPLRQRLPFFVLLSLTGIAVVLGAVQGAWLAGLGLALIGIAHAPLAFSIRAALLVATGVALALPRWGRGAVPWSSAIWPILGSMFMFRMIIYLYDRRHQTAPANVWQTLGYFFLLPNVCFPLFPVVDYKKFCRNYYDDERHRIYQVGVEWIWRGLIQLVFYRFVYYHLPLDSIEVSNLADLAAYMVATFLLYVRISGQFHLVVGMLHLFGFNLPETHHRYFLASSFTDFWRRINIYWKDFMLKVFYYPAYFRLRRLGDMKALIIATAFTFVATWFLHLVQWFWIRGSVLIEGNDIIFWATFGLLVMINSVYETRRPPARTLQRTRTLSEATGTVLRTVGTFTVICVLWSFWTAESASDWALMMRAALVLPPWSGTHLFALAAAAAVVCALAIIAVSKGVGTTERGSVAHTAPWIVVTSSLVLCALTLPAVAQRSGGGEILASLRSMSLNRGDAERYQRGYYENLLDVGRFNRELQRVYDRMPADFVRSLSALGLAHSTGDEQDYEMTPNREGRFVGAIVRTNRWGMRDRDYSLTRPAGTFRIALAGPSTAMGSGVEQDESFEALLETRLNDRHGQSPSTPIEILNFGVAGYSPFHMLVQLDRKVFRFDPNAVIFLGHALDVERASRQWSEMVREGTMPPEPFLEDLARRIGMHAGIGTTEAARRMKGHGHELLRWVYGRFVEQCTARGVQPIFVYMETVTDLTQPWRDADRQEVLATAREAGFPILDLTGAYDGYEPSVLWIAENDGHPNKLGNRLVADRLHLLLRERAHELRLPIQ
jgi:D-alanyl-lipoteichoic acid acyltransferase DltB (MBOAT superfamily)